MASQLSFGTILREAREKKGLDLTLVARRLRIRPDILEAIEDADFSRMPPRGYTRNMVNAYAHFLGLNATDVTRIYLDECYAYQVGTARAKNTKGHGFNLSPHETGQLRDNGSGRRRYSDGYRTEETSRMQRLYSEQNMHKTKRGTFADKQYTNFYSGPKAAPALANSKTPFAIAAALIAVLVIVILVLLFLPKENTSKDAPVVPVTGLEDKSGQEQASVEESNQKDQKLETAPTESLIKISIPAGKQAYLEIYQDGSSGALIAETVTGPYEKEIKVTNSLKIVTTSPNNVTVTADGQPLKFKDNTQGVYVINFRFADVLAQWKKDHPNAPVAGPAPTNSPGFTQDGGSSASSSVSSTSTDASDSSSSADTSEENETSSEESE